MSNLQNKSEARASFTDIIRKKPALEALADSQVMQGINTFQNLALEYAIHKLERSVQEGYLSTAYNRSSILALAEDRQYLSRKASPSRGKIKVRNTTNLAQSVTANFPIVSDDQIYYVIDESVYIQAGEEVVVNGSQVKHQELTFSVDKEEPFLEYEFGRDISVRLNKFRVFVDMGNGFEKWLSTNRFRNSRADKVFDEFYSHTDQVGIRFGNNVFGLIPPKGSKVRVELWLTEGDIKLMPNQSLIPVDDAVEGLEFETSSVFTGGVEREGTEELKKNALYYPLYDDNHVWDNDYLFYIKQNFPEVIWAKVWGEEEQEKMDGLLKEENRNKIFICAYAPNNPDIGRQITDTMKQKIPQFNLIFQYVPVNILTFNVKVSGKLLRTVTISAARKLIADVLWENYGRDSSKRKPKALKKDFYRLMSNLNVFENGDDIEVEISGHPTPSDLTQMIHIDLDESLSKLSLSYSNNNSLNIYE
ncbi:BplA [Vibrio nigripulchritudo SOn1]|uniref:BplA n=1 Tax=Vibrio nigripulchritudo SOn1 TaxID=1238450 RepID=A0AAV2VQA0_9VIBR|nr:LPS biosynthesis protein [Vibrio nigripulchritudo]CCO46640.1 BplA [Vibrio nigripulchritudo SOn1]